MKQDFQFILNRVSVDQMKVCVIQSKNGIMINVRVTVKNSMVECLVKMTLCGVPVRVALSVIRRVKLMNIQVIKIANGKTSNC